MKYGVWPVPLIVCVSPNPLVVLNCTSYIANSHSHFLLARRKNSGRRKTPLHPKPQRSHLVKRIWNLLPCRLGAIMTSNNISRQKTRSPHLSASCLVEQKAFKESLYLSRFAATVFTSSHDCHPASALSFSTVRPPGGFWSSHSSFSFWCPSYCHAAVVVLVLS